MPARGGTGGKGEQNVLLTHFSHIQLQLKLSAYCGFIVILV